MVARSRCSDPHQLSLTAYSCEIAAKSTRAAQSMPVMVPLRPHSSGNNNILTLIIRFNSDRKLCREPDLLNAFLRRAFSPNYANYGGFDLASQGTLSCSFSNIRILGETMFIPLSSSSSSDGFAYFLTGSTGSTFVNCVISGQTNLLGRNVGQFTTRPGATRFVNCSIVGNESGDMGGIVVRSRSSTTKTVPLSKSGAIAPNTTSGGNDILVNT